MPIQNQVTEPQKISSLDGPLLTQAGIEDRRDYTNNLRFDIEFPAAFQTVPIVVATVQDHGGDNEAIVEIYAVSKEGFTARILKMVGTPLGNKPGSDVSFRYPGRGWLHWIAVGRGA